MVCSTGFDYENLKILLENTYDIYGLTIRTCLSCWCSCLLQKIRGNVHGCAHGHCGNGRARGCGRGHARGENGCDRVNDSLREKPRGSARG